MAERVNREAVEARLNLHHASASEMLERIARRADPDVAESIRGAVQWMLEDRRALLTELFDTPDYNPGRAPDRR